MNNYETPEEKVRKEILATEGAISFKVVTIMGQEYMIDEMFEDEELERIYIELGLEDDDYYDDQDIDRL